MKLSLVSTSRRRLGTKRNTAALGTVANALAAVLRTATIMASKKISW